MCAAVMTEDNREELIENSKEAKENGKVLSDDVIIEIVHAFKDIIIEFIDRRYQSSPER